MSWLYYLLEANLYLCLFYAGYYLFFSRETFYTLNRIYLLAICILAFALPFTQLGILKPVEQPVETITQIQLSPTVIQAAPVAVQPGLTLDQALLYLYIAGIFASFLWFGFRLYKLLKLINNHSESPNKDCKIVLLDDQNTAFSFFNYLFIAKNIAQKEMILRHELVHIRQKHSADIVFTELVKALNWFNPVVYLLQNSLKAAHEYIADEQTAAIENDSISYSTFLVNNAYGIAGTSIAHSFFNYNLLKKRIIMLNQQRSGSLARLKYLLVVPLCAGMVCASTLAFSKSYGFDLLPQAPQKAEKTTAKSKVPPPPPVVVQLTPAEAKAFKDSVRANKPMKGSTKQPPKITVVKFAPPVLNKNKTIPEPEITVVKFAPPKPPLKAEKQAKNKQVAVYDVPMNQKKEAETPDKTAFEALLSHISHTIKYPVKARENKTAGGLNIGFNLDSDGKISNAKIASEMPDGCAEEALRAVSSYKGSIAQKPGYYTVSITFLLKNAKDEQVGKGKYAPPQLSNEAAGGVTVYGYVN
jgi:outer membrane biosynthesis protein TonB